MVARSRYGSNKEAAVRATRQDGTYPRPMLCRADWQSLDGRWGFVHDDDDVGQGQQWFDPAAGSRFTTEIEVPYVTRCWRARR